MVRLNLPKIKGANRLETAENICILFIISSAVLLSIGIGSTAVTTRGLPAVLSMLGAVAAFTSTVALVFIWLAKEFKE